jgi:SNF family Na+-dependent transporter
LIAEITLGRMAEKGGHKSMAINAIQQKRSPAWGMLGWLFVLSCFITVAAFNLVDGYLTI